MTDYIDKGTDTDALGMEWFTANYRVPEGITVTALEAVCSPLIVRVDNPENPQVFNITKEQSRQLKCGKNVVYLYGYDGEGKRFRFRGSHEFYNNPEA